MREGLVVSVLNPKSLVFFAAVLPQFVSPAGAAVPLQIAALGVIFMVVALLSDSIWALVGSRESRVPRRTRARFSGTRPPGALTR